MHDECFTIIRMSRILSKYDYPSVALYFEND